MNHVDKYYPIEIKRFHTLKKKPDAFILFSLVLVIVGLLIIVYKDNLPIHNIIGPIPRDPYRLILWYYRMDKLLHLMVVYGIAGVIVFSPISLVLGVKLKRLHANYKKEETGYHLEIKEIKRTLTRNMDTSKIYYP
ncbi:MAG: hypothetical protein ACFFE4_01650 [Candidatus Thorarchaeota archaeon]